MTFEEYLLSKKIDALAYATSEPHQWSEFKIIFGQMHPKSFTMQKLNLINSIRRRFPFAEDLDGKKEIKSEVKQPGVRPKTFSNKKISGESQPSKPAIKPRMARPVMKPKTKD